MSDTLKRWADAAARVVRLAAYVEKMADHYGQSSAMTEKAECDLAAALLERETAARALRAEDDLAPNEKWVSQAVDAVRTELGHWTKNLRTEMTVLTDALEQLEARTAKLEANR